MSIDWSAPPPAYESLQQSDTTTHISDRIQTTAHAESSIPNDGFAEVARLRNFLSYCIAVDYQCRAPNKLTSEDRGHYLGLAKVAMARRKAGSGDRVLAPYLRKHLYIPSYRLRISTDISQAVLVRFARHRSPYFGRYEGCETGIRQEFGMRVLAKKLWIDRQLLIPRLGLSEPTCLELNQALLRMARLYFISIDGTDSSGSVLMSSSGRDEDEATFKCVLNQHGRHCDDNRLVKVTLRQRGYQFIVHGISRLLRLDLYPKSRLPIFPDGCSG